MQPNVLDYTKPSVDEWTGINNERTLDSYYLTGKPRRW